MQTLTTTKRILLSGDEAFARGAWEAGVRFASSYPGTPSTEILENMVKYKEITAKWATNEKTAFEAAAGASIGGIRSLTALKHVGLNVASDPMFTFAYTGVNGGMVIITCDEPGMHSSQNEQDNRNYAPFAKIPLLEPSNSQECLDMIKVAFEISEEFDTPVLIRATTRICHSKTIVEIGERSEVAVKPYKKDIMKNIAIPAFAVKMRIKVEERLSNLQAYGEASPFNYIEKGGRIGVITSGMCYNFAKEVFGDTATYLKLGFTYPLPDNLLDQFYNDVDKVYIIEENDAYLQTWVERRGYECVGKPTIPPYGEMTPDVLRHAIYGQVAEGLYIDDSMLIARPPLLCSGCPHRGFFYQLAKQVKLKKTIISGDIGCYSLAFNQPFNAMDYIVCMGSAFSAAYGTFVAVKESGEKTRVVGVMGDSTFFHTGMNGLIDVIYNNAPVICIILDNRVTGMTGQQENAGSGRDINLQEAPEIDIAGVCRALGAKNVATVDPNNLKQVRVTLQDAYSKEEPYVIITRWPCVLKPMGESEYTEFGNDLFFNKFIVDEEKCIGCKACITVGCPSISMIKEGKVANIDETCVGCEVCAQVCPTQAIQFKNDLEQAKLKYAKK